MMVLRWVSSASGLSILSVRLCGRQVRSRFRDRVSSNVKLLSGLGLLRGEFVDAILVVAGVFLDLMGGEGVMTFFVSEVGRVEPSAPSVPAGLDGPSGERPWCESWDLMSGAMQSKA